VVYDQCFKLSKVMKKNSIKIVRQKSGLVRYEVGTVGDAAQ